MEKQDKIQDILQKFIQNKQDKRITFLSNDVNRYTLYFQSSNGKFVLVGDEKFPYSKSSLDVEWIDMNKHNFMYYEEFKELPQLLERNQEIMDKEKTDIVCDEEYGYTETQAEKLPNGWHWRIFDDNSGSLKSPTGKSYFSFDWSTREYKITEKGHYDYSYNYDDFGNKQNFEDFKKYAENYAKRNFANLRENKIESIQEKIEKAKEKAKTQISNSRRRDPIKNDRDGEAL